METYNWYGQLIKPSWSPPAWLFGPVWAVLYVLIAISFGRVFIMLVRREIPLIVAVPFALNIIFNLSFTWIQFGLKNNGMAAGDILLVLGTLIAGMVLIYPYAKWITYIQIPYLLWAIFATVLQLTVTYLNK